MNNHVYPKIHFPELYILEGGYCEYYRQSSHRCEPQGYITMDDPTHAASRREDLDQFRKTRFGRNKSFAYGDGLGKLSSSQPGGKRNLTPPEGSAFAAAAAKPRLNQRVASSSLMPLHEHANISMDGDDTDIDIGDSPCPPANKGGARRIGRGLMRSETYHAVRMVY
jgi:M-phase inducer tyrosine phosphatase